jgi:hypothetical protein
MLPEKKTISTYVFSFILSDISWSIFSNELPFGAMEAHLNLALAKAMGEINAV